MDDTRVHGVIPIRIGGSANARYEQGYGGARVGNSIRR